MVLTTEEKLEAVRRVRGMACKEHDKNRKTREEQVLTGGDADLIAELRKSRYI